MTNFKTIDETKDEMEKVANNVLEDLGELYQIVQNITRHYNPEKEINFKAIYKDKHINQNYGFCGLVERVTNSAHLLIEYRQDIESVRSKEGFTIMSEPEEKTICHHCKRELNVPGFYTAYTFMGETYCDNCIQIFNPESDEPKTNRKNQEFLSENLEDEK